MKKTKKLLLLVVSCMMAVAVQAQDCVMPIAVALKSATAQPLPIAQQRVVANKLRQLLSATSGATGTVGFHSFALVPDYEVLNKSVTPGPPRKTVYQLQLSIPPNLTGWGTASIRHSQMLLSDWHQRTRISSVL